MAADAAAQEIHQKTVVKYGVELRSELFGLGMISLVIVIQIELEWN